MRRAFLIASLVLVPTVAVAQPTALVLPISGAGVDPVVVQLLGTALRDRVQEKGYRLVEIPSGATGTPADPDAMRSVGAASGVRLTVAAEVSIPTLGRYRLTIAGVAVGGAGVWNASEEAAGADVLALLDRLVGGAVPTPSALETAGDGLPPIVGQSPPSAPAQPGTDGLPPVISNAPPSSSLPPIVGAPAPGVGPVDEGEEETMPVRRRRMRRIPRWSVGALTEAVVGMNRGFYNHLVGGRIQLAINQQFLGFATLAYAYYSDDPGFALVGHGGIEGRIRLGKRGKTGLPVRISIGYAPENGGLLKLDMGISIAIGRRTDLVLIPLAPTIWFLDGGNAVSMNFVIEINTGV